MPAPQQKVKIVHIVEAFGGGIFTFLADLVNTIGDDYDVTIIYAKRHQTPPNFKTYFPKNTKFIQSQYLARNLNPLQDFKAYLELRQLIKAEHPDVVHLHSAKAGTLGRLACIMNGQPKVLYNPHGFSFLMKEVSSTKRHFFFLVEKLIAKFPGTIIACSKGEYTEAKKLSSKVKLINNGLNLPQITAETSKLKYHQPKIKHPTICTVGRINYQKNPELFNQIALQNPDHQFVWIGDGPMRNLLAAKNITITGWQSRQSVLKLVNNADIFILTSLWEGLPISLLEAMYLKKLCIVSDVIGNHDVIKTGVNGYVTRTATDFTHRIQNLTKSQYHQLANRAHQDILTAYNLDQSAKKYQREYH